MTDYNTIELDRHQGNVDQTADEDEALDTYRTDFAGQLMQEYLEDNHHLSWQVAEWLGESSSQLEGYLFSALTDPDFDMAETWRDWLTENFEAMANGMSSKEIYDYIGENF